MGCNDVCGGGGVTRKPCSGATAGYSGRSLHGIFRLINFRSQNTKRFNRGRSSAYFGTRSLSIELGSSPHFGSLISHYEQVSGVPAKPKSAHTSRPACSQSKPRWSGSTSFHIPRT